MRHHYSAFGLLLSSELQIAGLAPETPAQADVDIVVGDVPEHLTFEEGSAGVLYQAGPQAFLLRIPDVARYLVRGGNEIVVQPLSDDKLDEVVVWLLGACFGALLYQRGSLCLHASGVAVDGAAVLFAGDSGAGKSTLLASFIGRGYEMVSDDICAISTDDAGTPVCSPSFPMVKLRTDAAAWLGYDGSTLTRVRNDLEKYWVHPPSAVSKPLPLRRVYILRQGSGTDDPISVTTIPPLRRFDALLRYSYFSEQLTGLKLMREHFGALSAVAGRADVRDLNRNMGPESLGAVVDRIVDDLQGG